MTLRRLAQTGRVRLLADLGGSVLIRIKANTSKRFDAAFDAVTRAGGTMAPVRPHFVTPGSEESEHWNAYISKSKARRLGLLTNGKEKGEGCG